LFPLAVLFKEKQTDESAAALSVTAQTGDGGEGEKTAENPAENNNATSNNNADNSGTPTTATSTAVNDI
jgi:hypothetical protein